jgi:hypothetical protein
MYLLRFYLSINDPNIISGSVENDRSGNTYHNYIYNVQNNQRNMANVQSNIVMAEEGEIEEAKADEDEIPELEYRDDSSDDKDEDYYPSGEEDVELEADEDYRSGIEDDDDPKPVRTCSGRPVKEQKFYHEEYQFLYSPEESGLRRTQSSNASPRQRRKMRE